MREYCINECSDTLDMFNQPKSYAINNFFHNYDQLIVVINEIRTRNNQ